MFLARGARFALQRGRLLPESAALPSIGWRRERQEFGSVRGEGIKFVLNELFSMRIVLYANRSKATLSTQQKQTEAKRSEVKRSGSEAETNLSETTSMQLCVRYQHALPDCTSCNALAKTEAYPRRSRTTATAVMHTPDIAPI